MSVLKYNFAQRMRWVRLLLHSRSSKLNEPVALDILSKISRPSPVIFDIGANIGLFIKAFNKSAFQPKAIYAFEPSSYVHSILKVTVARFKNVRCFKLAFDKQDGETILNMPLKKSGSIRVGLSHIGNVSEGEYLKETVRTMKLDHFIKEQAIEAVDLIKIDVEGAEYNILQGADALLRDMRPFWFVEISEAANRFANTRQDTFDIFMKADYAAFYFDQDQKWQRLDEINQAEDFLFVPKEELADFTQKL